MALADFQPSALQGFDGAEIDIRLDAEGAIAVFHSPILTLARRPARGAVKELGHVLAMLAENDASRRLLFLDVKTKAAAERVGELLERLEPQCDVAFICWHQDALAPLRDAQPEARLFLGVAPYRAARLTRRLPTDFYVFNRFPYVAKARRYRPAERQFNQHNINVRRFDLCDVAASVPRGVTGLCFHKVFFDPRLARAARRRGLEIALYGFTTRRDPKIDRLDRHIDFAIVDPERNRDRRGRGARR